MLIGVLSGPGDSLPASASALGAHNDAEAISVWLQAKGARSGHTFTAYQREASRLIAWIEGQALTLNTLKVEHAHRYYHHLANPPQEWIKPPKARANAGLLQTQLMAGPLSNKSINYTRTVLSQLFSYLQDAGYIKTNVFRLSFKPAVTVESTPTRFLDLECWEWLWEWVCSIPVHSPLTTATASRSRWLLALLYHSGIRRSEAAGGVMGDFTRKGGGWTLRVLGKGQRERFVTVNSALLYELKVYRKAARLEAVPYPGEQTPLICSIKNTRGHTRLTDRSIGRLIESISLHACGSCEDEHLRAQLGKLTTHWMRHTNATHRFLAGATLESTQDELGHVDPRTTRIYAKTSTHRRVDDAEKLATLSSARGHE